MNFISTSLRSIRSKNRLRQPYLPIAIAAIVLSCLLCLSFLATLFSPKVSAQPKVIAMQQLTHYRSIKVDGTSIFYREAGSADAPTLLLLHGFPSSSRMFEPLMQRLSGQFHLIAPDYPGFGHSDAPDPKQFAYTFDHIATLITRFTEQLHLDRYTLYLQDYGGPVGFRMALAHPERVESLIIQNTVIHNQGLSPIWDKRRAFWTDRAANEKDLRKNFFSLETTGQRHLGTDPNISLYDPDLWTDEFAFLNRTNIAQIQSDLFYDYRTNVAAYPKWQAWLKQKQPRLLVLWGKYDTSFQVEEAAADKVDVPSAQVFVLDAGHFAMDTKAANVAYHISNFLNPKRSVPR